jgi:hypothetical protein
MSDSGLQFIDGIQQQIDEIRAQIALLPPGKIRSRLVTRATALEVSMKAYSLVGPPVLEQCCGPD